MKKILLISALSFVSIGCKELSQVATEVQKQVNTPAAGLSLAEITSGLKQALEIGTGNAVTTLNKSGGYLNNSLVKIPFPPDAQRAADKLRELGMGKMVDDFVISLNTAAEQAALEAKPIFVNAVKEMTFDDAKNILNGPDNAATEYFKGKTSQNLSAAFAPKIKTSLDNVKVTKYWNDITSTYNKIPFVQKVETDLTKYATDKALAGLFLTLQGEEKKIRKDPAARVTDLLKKVFAK